MKVKPLTREEKWDRFKVGVYVEDLSISDGTGKIVKKLKNILQISCPGRKQKIIVYDKLDAIKFLRVVK